MRYTLTGLWRRTGLLLRRRELIVGGKCNMCGRCCTSLNFTLGGGWVRSRRVFELMKERHAEYEYFEIAGRAPGGALTFRCRLLGDDGLCSDHGNRPAFCREYPSREVYFLGGELLRDCGFRFEAAPSFRKILKREEGARHEGKDEKREFRMLNIDNRSQVREKAEDKRLLTRIRTDETGL